VCLVVLGRHVDRFKFLDVMLGDQPPLTPPELTYQRMLAGDSDEAADQAEEFLQDASLLTYYEKVLVEALKLAQDDAERGLLELGYEIQSSKLWMTLVLIRTRTTWQKGRSMTQRSGDRLRISLPLKNPSRGTKVRFRSIGAPGHLFYAFPDSASLTRPSRPLSPRKSEGRESASAPNLEMLFQFLGSSH
jgi:hypothetical protein